LTSALSWGCFARPGLAGGTVSVACRDLRSALPWGFCALPGRAIKFISASSWGCFALPVSARGTVACRSRKTWGSGGSSTCLRGKGLMSLHASPLGCLGGAGARRSSACWCLSCRSSGCWRGPKLVRRLGRTGCGGRSSSPGLFGSAWGLAGAEARRAFLCAGQSASCCDSDGRLAATRIRIGARSWLSCCLMSSLI
jgi:hypothetical protein